MTRVDVSVSFVNVVIPWRSFGDPIVFYAELLLNLCGLCVCPDEM